MIKETAHERLLSIIKTCGYSETEGEMLLAQFLEEEARIYLESMHEVDESDDDYVNTRKRELS